MSNRPDVDARWTAAFEASADTALIRLNMLVVFLFSYSTWGLWLGLAYGIGIHLVCVTIAAVWGAWRASVNLDRTAS